METTMTDGTEPQQPEQTTPEGQPIEGQEGPDNSIEENSDQSNILALTPELEKKLSAVIDSNWQSADAGRRKWMLDKQEGLNLYWGLVKKKDFPFKGCANLHVPLIRTISDTLHSNLMGSIDFDKPCSITPVGPEDVPKARKAEKLLNWQFTTQVDYFDLVDKIAQAVLIFGHAPVKVRYVVERSNGEKVYDGLKVDLIQPERLLMPPDAADAEVQDMDYVIQEIPMTKSDLKKRIAAGMYNPVSDDDLSGINGKSSRNDRESEEALENIRQRYSGIDNDQQHETSKKYLTVIEWHGSFDTDEDGIEERLMVTMVQESKKVLRVVRQKNKRPFVVVRFSQILDKAVGESLPDLLKHINQELNVLHNQRVDSVTITNIPFFFFDPVAGFNPDEITLSPGVGIPTNGSPTQAVYFPSLNTSRPEMYKEEDLLFQYAERMLGAGANTQGIMQTKRVTATEIQAVDRRSGIRFLTVFNRVKKGLRGVLQLALELDKAHMPPEIQVRVVGFDSGAPIFESMTPQDISGKFDIAINGNSIMDDQAEKQEMLQAYNLGMMNPIIARDENAIYELTRDLFQTLKIKRVDSYLRKPEDTIPKRPEEEHNLFLQEEDVKPNIGEDVDDHLKKHAALINDPNKFNLLSNKGKAQILKHYTDTVKMQQILQQLAIMQKMEATNGALMQMHMGQAGANGQPNGMVPGQGAGPPVP